MENYLEHTVAILRQALVDIAYAKEYGRFEHGKDVLNIIKIAKQALEEAGMEES